MILRIIDRISGMNYRTLVLVMALILSVNCAAITTAMVVLAR